MSVEAITHSPIAPREHARAARRQLLLKAAEQVFAERGFAGSTMAEIASRAGYSAANLYNVFENKEALFSEVLTSSAELVLDCIHAADKSGESFERTLDQLIDSILSFVAEHRGFFVILTQTNPEFDWRRSRQSGEGTDIGDELGRANERLFARGIASGEIPELDPQAYGCVFRGAINNYIARWVSQEGTTEELWAGAKDLRIVLKQSVGMKPLYQA
jgi:AcrR family transcriptional regulator